MNFYKHYIGDFQRDTGHLSLTERGAYLCLMHHYYATEKPLPSDHAALCRIAGALTKQEKEAVRVAMSFFHSVDSGLMHNRIEAEIQKAERQADTNRGIAQAREAARRAQRTEHADSTNRATNRAPNQTPDTKNQKRKKTPAEPSLTLDDLIADGVSPEAAAGFLALRRKKRADLTALAWAGLKAEAAKAGWSIDKAVRKAITRNWTTFEAAWVASESPTAAGNVRSFRERADDAAAARMHELSGGHAAAKRYDDPFGDDMTIDMEVPHALAIGSD